MSRYECESSLQIISMHHVASFQEALRNLCYLTGVNEADAIKTLMENDQSDHFCVAYRLILDNM